MRKSQVKTPEQMMLAKIEAAQTAFRTEINRVEVNLNNAMAAITAATEALKKSEELLKTARIEVRIPEIKA